MYPNKPTIIAMVLYALSEQARLAPKVEGPVHPHRPKPQPTLWIALDAQTKAPFIKAAEFILASSVGADLAVIDRGALEKSLAKQAIGEFDYAVAVSLALNIHATLT